MFTVLAFSISRVLLQEKAALNEAGDSPRWVGLHTGASLMAEGSHEYGQAGHTHDTLGLMQLRDSRASAADFGTGLQANMAAALSLWPHPFDSINFG